MQFFKSKKVASRGEAATSGSDSTVVPTDATPPTALENEVPADEALAPTQTTQSEMQEYPHGIKLALIMLSIFVSMFLVALVRPSPARY
jgi:hypothetical protein